jgi:hypothetical protein
MRRCLCTTNEALAVFSKLDDRFLWKLVSAKEFDGAYRKSQRFLNTEFFRVSDLQKGGIRG